MFTYEDHPKPHDLNELLELIVEQATRFTKAERVLIYLYDKDEGLLWNRAGTGADLMELEFKAGEGLPGKVIDTLELIKIDDSSADDRFDPLKDNVTDVELKSTLLVPISGKDSQKIGVIQVINKSKGEFETADALFLQSVGAQAAVAIDNLVLFNSLEQTLKREQELMEKVKAQNKELQAAYLDVEQKQQDQEENFKSKSKNINIALIVAGVVVVGVLGYFWRAASFSSPSEEFYTESALEFTEEQIEQANTHTVATEALNFPITLTGSLEPSEVHNMVAPFATRIESVNFVAGVAVKKGQELMRLNTEKLELEYRSAEIKMRETKEEYDAKVNWMNSPDVTQSLDDLQDKEERLAKAEREYQQSQKLFSLGIISEQELNTSKDGVSSAEDSLNQSKRSHAEVLDKGDVEAVSTAELAWINAKLSFEENKKKLDNAIIRAPINGVAILPNTANDDNQQMIFEQGMEIAEGTVFIAIADMSRLGIKGQIDEVDISKVHNKQEVTIFGDAFEGIVLNGEVTYVSSEAKTSGRRASFDIKVLSQELTATQLKALRLGMTATMSINTYTNPDAILVPFDVVSISPEGNFVYRKQPGVTEPEQISVTTGVTTASSIEILDGLSAGDELIYLK